MKGVLVKDLYIARSNILTTIVSLVVIGFGLSFLLEPGALLVLAPAVSTTAAFISITSDAASKWNKNVITMPVSRKQIIGEKFLFYILLALLGTAAALVSCAVPACLGAAGGTVTLHSLCLYGAIGISAALLAGGISLPCAYLFDPGKITGCLYDVLHGGDGDHYRACAPDQLPFSGKGKYPSGVLYCACHFYDLVFSLIPDRGEDIPEAGCHLKNQSAVTFCGHLSVIL